MDICEKIMSATCNSSDVSSKTIEKRQVVLLDKLGSNEIRQLTLKRNRDTQMRYSVRVEAARRLLKAPKLK